MTSMVSTEMISIKNETFLAWANAKDLSAVYRFLQ